MRKSCDASTVYLSPKHLVAVSLEPCSIVEKQVLSDFHNFCMTWDRFSWHPYSQPPLSFTLGYVHLYVCSTIHTAHKASLLPPSFRLSPPALFSHPSAKKPTKYTQTRVGKQTHHSCVWLSHPLISFYHCVYTGQELKEIYCSSSTKYRTRPAVHSQPLCHLAVAWEPWEDIKEYPTIGFWLWTVALSQLKLLYKLEGNGSGQAA